MTINGWLSKIHFVYYFNLHFPLQKIPITMKTKINFDTPEIKKCREKLDLLYELSRHRSDCVDMYNRTKSKYKELLRKTKSGLLGKRISEADNKPKVIWNIIGELTKGNYTQGTVPKGESEKIVNDFNKFFVTQVDSVNNKADLSGKNKTKIPFNENTLYLKPVTVSEIVCVSQELKNKKSSGADGIPVFILKKCIVAFAKHLVHIINVSMEEGKFPHDLKNTIIIPVFKKGDPDNLANYRPISLQSSFSRFFEKAMYNRIIDFFTSQKMLHNFQHGFLKQKSTDTAVFNLIEKVLDAFERGSKVCGLFLDLSKAFDSINHDLILDKLYRYGVRGQAYSWLDSYLRNRAQRVRIIVEGAKLYSGTENALVGVPQGSVLGPLLFIIFLNDLPATVSGNNLVINYADDTNLLIEADNIPDLVSKSDLQIRTMSNWFERNELILNQNKTQCVFFKTSRSNATYPQTIELKNYTLNTLDCSKFLGIYIDSALNYQNHVDILCKKLSSSCYALRILAGHLNQDALKTAYYGGFYSYLKYGIIFWGNSSNILRVFVIQKRAMRILNRMHFRDTCRGVFRGSNMLTAVALCIFEGIMFLKRHPSIFEEYIINHSHSTRKLSLYYNYPAHELTLTEKSCRYSCIRYFNHLPKYIASISHLVQFRSTLFEYLCQMEPYTFNDYFGSRIT